MAAPVIKIKRSSVPGKIPTTASLPLGELALNTNDGKVYIQQDSVGIGSTVIVVNPWSVGLGSDTYNTFFNTGNVGIATTNPTSKFTVIGDASISGVVTASSFVGDGSALTGISGGISVRFNNINIGTGITSLNFSGAGISSVTSNISGISTITVDLQSNLDGGSPDTNYGGIDAIEGGSV